MNILVTGATGFVGRHQVPELLRRGHQVAAAALDDGLVSRMPWHGQARFIPCDVNNADTDPAALFKVPDVLVHLAWPRLPNYAELFHIEENLPGSYRFIKSLVAAGVKQVLVTGTCFEYGIQNGPLSEDMPTAPVHPYGLAKDTLRKFLEALQRKQPFILQWARLFYMYGPGQNPKSLLADLDRAVDAGEASFNMSGGEQLRDFLPVQEVARRLAVLAGHPECRGIVNCCSGKPVSVRSLVEARLRERGSRIKLNLGHYPYLASEPMAFWGDPGRMQPLLDAEPGGAP